MFKIIGSVVFLAVVVGGYFLVNGIPGGSTGNQTTKSAPTHRSSPDDDAFKNLKF